MANMTYRDIPVLRSAGFECSSTGNTWYKKDKDGNLWQVSEGEDMSALLSWTMIPGPSRRMSREMFEELFSA